MPKPGPRALPARPCAHPARGASQPPLQNAPSQRDLQEEVSVTARKIIDLDRVGAEHSVLDNQDGLDEATFRHFAPLLHASQEYAGHTGFRFRGGSFDGLEELSVALEEENDAGKVDAWAIAGSSSRLAAKLHAMPAVKSFGERLTKGEPELDEELERAFRIIVAESARNMMIATVKGLGLFPPTPSPEGVSEEDCSYEDASAPLPVIAQRLYNDHVRREKDECSSAKRQQRRSMTAAFLVDFAHEVGVSLPPIPETYQTLLQEFAARNADFSAQAPTDLMYACEPEDDMVVSEKSMVPEKADAGQSWWLQRWQMALWAPAGTAAVSEAQKAQAPKRRARPTGCV